MSFGPATYGLALLAGVLSTLSPCVLPLIPVLVASATDAHPAGVLVLGGGLALSFAAVGLFLATLGASLGLDPETFRVFGAVLLALFGVLLVSHGLQLRFASATAGVGQTGHRLLARVTSGGLRGQFLVGTLLGVVWSPCVGPTLGAASTLAAQGRDLKAIALLMMVFGIGAALPLMILGSVSHASRKRLRGKLIESGERGRQVMGVALLSVSILILTRLDKSLEAWALDHVPGWLTQISIRF